MKYFKAISISNCLVGALILLCAYRQTNGSAGLDSLYAPFINNKWQFYAVGNAVGKIAYQYDSTERYNPPVYTYFKLDKHVEIYKGKVIANYAVIDASTMKLSMGLEADLTYRWGQLLRDKGKSNISATNKYSFTDSTLIIHFIKSTNDSTLIFRKL